MDDEVVNEKHARYKAEADDSQGVQRLVIDTAAKSDEGAFKCKAENSEGVASTTGYLSVTGHPTILSLPSHSAVILDRKQIFFLGSSKDNSTSDNGKPHRRLHREQAISVPTPLGTIIEQKSIEEREALQQAASGSSPLQVPPKSNTLHVAVYICIGNVTSITSCCRVMWTTYVVARHGRL